MSETKKPRLLVSACLLGERCRYDGGTSADLRDRLTAYEVIPVCPECLGGLPTPRTPCERRGDRVITRDGIDRTAAYWRGAEQACELAQTTGCTAALLKERSPSCGHGEIYDGTFSGTRVPGDGMTAERLLAAGIAVYGESAWPALVKDE